MVGGLSAGGDTAGLQRIRLRHHHTAAAQMQQVQCSEASLTGLHLLQAVDQRLSGDQRLQCWPMACIAQVLPFMVVGQPASVKTHRRLIALKADPAAAAMADAPSLAALGRLAGRAGSTKSWSHQARQSNMAPTGLCQSWLEHAAITIRMARPAFDWQGIPYWPGTAHARRCSFM